MTRDVLAPSPRRFVLGLAAVLLSTACTTAPGPEIRSAEAADLSASCTGKGTHRIIPSVNGSFPLLPDSARGHEYTPLVRLSGIRQAGPAATVDLSVVSEKPNPSDVRSFDRMFVGDEVTYGGYTIKMTSICAGEARFDVIGQPG